MTLYLLLWARIPSRNRVAFINSKSLKCSTRVQPQKRQNDLGSFPRQTVQPHSNPSLCPNHQCWRSWSVLWRTITKDGVLFILGDWNAKLGSQEILRIKDKFGLRVQNEALQKLQSFVKRTCWSCCSVAKTCLTLCYPMDWSTPGLSVSHCLPEFAQVHVHWISDDTQPSHPVPPSSPFAGHSKHPFPTTLHMDTTRWSIAKSDFFLAEDGEALYSQQKEDLELTVS